MLDSPDSGCTVLGYLQGLQLGKMHVANIQSTNAVVRFKCGALMRLLVEYLHMYAI